MVRSLIDGNWFWVIPHSPTEIEGPYQYRYEDGKGFFLSPEGVILKRHHAKSFECIADKTGKEMRVS